MINIEKIEILGFNLTMKKCDSTVSCDFLGFSCEQMMI